MVSGVYDPRLTERNALISPWRKGLGGHDEYDLSNNNSASMKVGVWLRSTYHPEAGGGYSYYDLLIEQIDQYKFHPDLDICFLSEATVEPSRLQKSVIVLSPGKTLPLIYMLLWKLSPWIPVIGSRVRRFIDSRIRFQGKRLHNILIENKIDLIYYPIQAYCKINDFPFVINNWDLGHLTGFTFPEVAMRGNFESREEFYRKILPKALCIFAESEAGKSELIRFLNIAEQKIKVVPLFPGRLVFQNMAEEERLKIITGYGLVDQRYFFYPGQFWAHKNHYGLLIAFEQVRRRHPELKLVFCGSDKGNRVYIHGVIKRLRLSEHVLDLGFVEDAVIYALYKHAAALVMPTYIGPTNMPLLEALMLDCPVLCSDMEGHREMMNDSALFFPAERSECMADVMKAILDRGQREALLDRAKSRRGDTNFDITSAIKKIEQNLLEILPIRKSWGNI